MVKSPLDLDICVIDAYLLGTLQEVKRTAARGTLEQGFQQGVMDARGLGTLGGGLETAMDVAIRGLNLQDIKKGLPLYCEPKGELGEERVTYLGGYAKGFVDAAEIITGQGNETLRGYFHRAMITLELQSSTS
jgi:hypothetical protein